MHNFVQNIKNNVQIVDVYYVSPRLNPIKMKKIFILLLLCTIFGAQALKAANEAYAVHDTNTGTFTFYYDSQKSSRTGTVYSLNGPGESPEWGWQSCRVVYFDESFKNYRPTSTREWFSGWRYLVNIANIQNLNTSEVTDMSNMFKGCSSLERIKIGFNTAKVTNMSNMFNGCTSLSILDLTGFDTSKVTDMSSMFYGCSNLLVIFASDLWSTTAVTSSSNMFYGCEKLIGGNGTHYNSSYVDKARACIDGNPAGYFTTKGTLIAYAVERAYNKNLTFYYDTNIMDYDGNASLRLVENYPFYWYSCGLIQKVTFSSSFKDFHPKTCERMFYGMSELTEINGIENLNTSEATSMKEMFSGCKKLSGINLKTFNTANVTDMKNMFYDCESLTSLDLSSFNTAKVTDMMSMFDYCFSLTSVDLSSFNTTNVTQMHDMFRYCYKLESIDLSNFNTAKVTNMSDMFCDCLLLTEIDLSSFNIDKVNSLRTMFYNCNALKTIYVNRNWKVKSGAETSRMFEHCKNLVGGKGTAYDASHIDGSYAHIDGGESNPGYLSEHEPEGYAVFDSSNSRLTFYYDNAKTSRIGDVYPLNSGDDYPEWTGNDVVSVSFDPSFADARPTSTYCWFAQMYNLEDISGIDNLNTSEVTNMSCMFMWCESLTSIDVKNFNTAKVTDMSGMFLGCRSVGQLDMSSFNTSKVTNMSDMFSGVSAVLDLSKFNTSSVTSMNGMFSVYGTSETTLDLSRFNTSSVTDMSNMFSYCSIKTIDVSSFNTSKVNYFDEMFCGAANLTTIYASGDWDRANIASSGDMFYECENLVGGKGTTYNGVVDGYYARIDGGESRPGYFTLKATYDLNGDGKVSTADIQVIINEMKKPQASQNMSYDLNSDGKISTADIQVIINEMKK